MGRRLFWIIPAAIAGITLFIVIGGTAVQLLWNWLMPQLFGWREVTFWQALGLLALCRILFGGFGGGKHGRGRRWSREDKDRFRERMRERRAHMRERWGFPSDEPTA
jgi:hypothetical protein